MVWEPAMVEIDIGRSTSAQLNVNQVIQLFAKRVKGPDSSEHRKHVVQAQWVQECLEARKRLKLRGDWDIRSVYLPPA